MNATRVRWLGPVAAGLSLILAGGMLLVALGAKADADDALDNSRRLYHAQLDVAEAQEALGGSDLGDANEAAADANRTALRVGEVTERIVARLGGLKRAVDDLTSISRRGSQNAVFARRQTDVASDLLGSIRGYQTAAARLALTTNDALERVLRALEETNEDFPGGDFP